MRYVGIHKKGELTFSDLLKSIKGRSDFQRVGAIATFIGIVRGTTLESENVEGLELEAYEEQANTVLGEICKDLKGQEGVVDVQIHHFVGEFSVGEDLVYVMVAGGHREDVFGVLRTAVERYKSEVPIFKKEYVLDAAGTKKSYWVGEREARENHRQG